MNENEGSPAPTYIHIMYPKVKKENRIESLIFTSICWLFTLAIWIFLILLIMVNSPEPKITIDNFHDTYTTYPTKKKLKIFYSITFSLLYIIYLIIEFSSPILKYLYNKEKEKTIIEKMNSLFKKIPSLK